MKAWVWRIAAVALFLVGIGMAFQRASTAGEVFWIAVGAGMLLTAVAFVEHRLRSR